MTPSYHISSAAFKRASCKFNGPLAVLFLGVGAVDIGLFMRQSFLIAKDYLLTWYRYLKRNLL